MFSTKWKLEKIIRKKCTNLGFLSIGKLFVFQKLPTGTNVYLNVILARVAFSRSQKCLDLRCYIIENIHSDDATKIHIKGLGYTL